MSSHYWIIRYLTTDYFGHLMQTVDSVERPLVLGKTEGRRRRRYQRMRGLHCITDAMDMNLGKRWEVVRDREASRAAVHGVTKNWTWLGNWATTTTDYQTSFLAGSEGKESTWNEGDPGSIPGSGRSPEEGNGYLLQCSYLKKPMDRGTWQARVHGITESDIVEWLTHLIIISVGISKIITKCCT